MGVSMSSIHKSHFRATRVALAATILILGGCGLFSAAPSIRAPGTEDSEPTEFGVTFPVRNTSSPVSFAEILLCSDDGRAEITSVKFEHAEGLQVARFATELTGPEGGHNDPPRPGEHMYQEVDLATYGFSLDSRMIESRCADPERRWTRLGMEVHTEGAGKHRGSVVAITYVAHGSRAIYRVPMTLVLCVGAPYGVMCDE